MAAIALIAAVEHCARAGRRQFFRSAGSARGAAGASNRRDARGHGGAGMGGDRSGCGARQSAWRAHVLHSHGAQARRRAAHPARARELVRASLGHHSRLLRHRRCERRAQVARPRARAGDRRLRAAAIAQAAIRLGAARHGQRERRTWGCCSISSHDWGEYALDLNAGYMRRSGDGSEAPRRRDAVDRVRRRPRVRVRSAGWPRCSAFRERPGPRANRGTAALLTGPTFTDRASGSCSMRGRSSRSPDLSRTRCMRG